MEILKSCLERVLGHQLYMALPKQGDRITEWWSLEGTSGPISTLFQCLPFPSLMDITHPYFSPLTYLNINLTKLNSEQLY